MFLCSYYSMRGLNETIKVRSFLVVLAAYTLLPYPSNMTLTPSTIDQIIKLIAPNGFDERNMTETSYPERTLLSGAEVVRVAPSPTGFVHIGTIYAALLCQRLADQTKGVYYLRIEDTDKKREIVGGTDNIETALRVFGLQPQESPSLGGAYGPYLQSLREKIYLGYAIELLKAGRAYPCFATPLELEQNVKDQQIAKVRPGYYGTWALWREKTEDEILAALKDERPFVLRFRSNGSHEKRIVHEDVLKGTIELPENDLDIPLIKADGSHLPSYHLAHVVDDHLMGTTLVLRGDEWLPSTPLHIELAQALNISPFRYAHIAPISIIDKNGGGKRKLSKRKDPEANIAYFYEVGYPVVAVRAYLLGLASSDFEQWQKDNPDSNIDNFVVTLDRLAKSRSPLYDPVKLNDIAKNIIGSLPQAEYDAAIKGWLFEFGVEYCRSHQIDPQVPSLMLNHIGELLPAFQIERTGEKIRKDIAKWSDVIDEYGYFVDDVFDIHFAPNIGTELKDFSDDTIQNVCKNFLANYSIDDPQDVWFSKLKQAAEQAGFATDNKAYKASPDDFKGNVADFARILRVKLTGKNRTPDLCAVMSVMGSQRVAARLG